MTRAELMWTVANFILMVSMMFLVALYLMVRMDALTDCAVLGLEAVPTGLWGWECVPP